jgi:hypothetical protein
VGAGRVRRKMLRRPVGGLWRLGLSHARCSELRVEFRGASGLPSGTEDHVVGAGEPDRFGGVSVRLARLGALDRLDAAAFRRALQGKCAPARGLLPASPRAGPGGRGTLVCGSLPSV